MKIRNIVRSSIAMAAFFLAYTVPAIAESFVEYVAACKKELGIDSIPSFSCDKEQFRYRTSTPYLGLNFSDSDDFVAHRKINDYVDAVFACRWVGRYGGDDLAASGEMIVHNRKTGGTCFFDLQDTFQVERLKTVSVSPGSPTDAMAEHTWSIGSSCTQCHVAGPYIASPQIVGALAKFGLINDRHDTNNGKYHAIGAANSTVAPRLNQQLLNVTEPSCVNGCHVVRGGPNVSSVIGNNSIETSVVMPSINHVIEDIRLNGHMPPNAEPYSNYRWVNRDYPGGDYDSEKLADINREFPDIACSNPVRTEAHIVDSSAIYYSDTFYEKVRTFNLKEGLVCKNSDQTNGGQCADYATRYRCDGKWTGWYSHDRTSTGDDESRSRYPNLCVRPTGIQVRIPMYSSGRLVAYVERGGPPDRLQQFDNKGLVCKNADQPDGKRCQNYVVRFICNGI
jgi:hypothetical protein